MHTNAISVDSRRSGTPTIMGGETYGNVNGAASTFAQNVSQTGLDGRRSTGCFKKLMWWSAQTAMKKTDFK